MRKKFKLFSCYIYLIRIWSWLKPAQYKSHKENVSSTHFYLNIKHHQRKKKLWDSHIKKEKWYSLISLIYWLQINGPFNSFLCTSLRNHCPFFKGKIKNKRKNIYIIKYFDLLDFNNPLRLNKYILDPISDKKKRWS